MTKWKITDFASLILKVKRWVALLEVNQANITRWSWLPTFYAVLYPSYALYPAFLLSVWRFALVNAQRGI